MRELKFRAWAKNNKKMVYPDKNGWYHNIDTRYVTNDDVFHGSINQTLQLGLLLQTPSIIPMQYTGLKDKNGNKVFEGDIIDDKADRCIGKIVFQCYGFFRVTKEFGYESLCQIDHSNLEIIGNIYENPELLEDIE